MLQILYLVSYSYDESITIYESRFTCTWSKMQRLSLTNLEGVLSLEVPETRTRHGLICTTSRLRIILCAGTLARSCSIRIPLLAGWIRTRHLVIILQSLLLLCQISHLSQPMGSNLKYCRHCLTRCVLPPAENGKDTRMS